MENISRRRFLKTSAATAAVVSACMCGLSGCATITKVGDTPPIHPEAFKIEDGILSVHLSKEPVLSKVGGSVKVTDPSIPDGLILVHDEENSYKIASLLCTHRGVEVEYDHGAGLFECASLGGSRFSLQGEKMSGFAETPLKAYDAVLKDGVLTVRIQASNPAS